MLARKPRSTAEIYNDIDGRVVNVFRVLRHAESAIALQQLVADTPYARAELEGAALRSDDAIEDARRTLIRSFMGHGSKGATSNQKNGFHTALSDEGRYSRATSWASLPDVIASWRDRLQGVVIENVDALSLFKRFDEPTTLWYVDPPYNGQDVYYRTRFTVLEHAGLADALEALQGFVVLSSYPDAWTAERYRGWKRQERPSRAFGNNDRREVLWLNPRAAEAFAAGAAA